MRHRATGCSSCASRVVGASGYVVNLAVFALARAGARRSPTGSRRSLAFLVAFVNNFWLNRHWTFAAGDGHAGFQAARFFTVSVVAFLFSSWCCRCSSRSRGSPKVPAQAIAIVAATPLSFLGQKLWSFSA